jgi:hypothetical protein
MVPGRNFLGPGTTLRPRTISRLIITSPYRIGAYRTTIHGVRRAGHAGCTETLAVQERAHFIHPQTVLRFVIATASAAPYQSAQPAPAGRQLPDSQRA